MSGQSVLKWRNGQKSDEVSPFNHRDLARALKQAKRQRTQKIDFGAPRGKEVL